MFDKTITNSDDFLELPDSSQVLYFHLSMNADDDGFVNNWKSIMKMTGTKEDDMKLLIIKQYIIPFDSGIIVIKHWRINNYLRNDRYQETKFKEEKAQLLLEKNEEYKLKDNSGIPVVYPDKNRIDKNSIDNIYGQKFEIFYQEYPKHLKKNEVKKWFIKNKPDDELFNTIMEQLKKFKKTKEWKDTQYIPYPSTWLNQRRWEDQIKTKEEIEKEWVEELKREVGEL
jgi:hypothetical protein